MSNDNDNDNANVPAMRKSLLAISEVAKKDITTYACNYATSVGESRTMKAWANLIADLCDLALKPIPAAQQDTACVAQEKPKIEQPAQPIAQEKPKVEQPGNGGQAVDEDTSDGYHTFRELYRYRMLYNAAFFNMLARHTNIQVVKSRRHGDGELCFGGGWFIVMAQLPTGQVSNHYEDRYWGLFDIPAVEMALEWDGHTPNDAADRLESFLKIRKPDSDRSNPPGNTSALREALEEQLRYWNAHVRTRDEEEMRKRTEAALSKPPRNCDRFDDELDAQLAFLNEVWLISVDRDSMLERDRFENWTDEMKTRYGRWLFATARGEAK